MRPEFPDPDGPLSSEWTAPMETVARVVTGDPRYRFFDPDDFMVMVRLVRTPRPAIVGYKHLYTRGYLHLDVAGGAYRFVAAKDLGRSGRHLRQPLDEAIRALALYELPWMKPGLELERRGLRWEERWLLRRYLETGDLDDEGGQQSSHRAGRPGSRLLRR